MTKLDYRFITPIPKPNPILIISDVEISIVFINSD